MSRLSLAQAAVIVGLLMIGVGCGGPARYLIVRSEPADAEICIKGRSTSDHFKPEKSCIGTTPFESDRVEVTDADGHKRIVKFKDVERDGESFFVVVTRKGYDPQAAEVPGWEHLVVLRPVK